ncbi:ubiquitin-binding protein cue5 [Amphichorda felina]
MAAATDTPTKGTGDSGAESPTTARPLEMDDDDVQETGVMGGDGNTTSTTGQGNAANAPTTTSTTETSPAPETPATGGEEAAPAKPPRPLTEAQKNEMTLKEAFPGVDASVIKAVLSASGGRVEPAFNALLEMTDPDAARNEPQEAPPPQPPRPQGRPEMSQLEADELYARQLAEHYDNVGAYEARTSNRHRDDRTRQHQQGYGDDDKEYSFIDDDLPAIRENLRQGFLETQTKVNGWINNFKKRLEDSFDESEEPRHHQGQRRGEPSRRSGDYDADPQVLSDDFAGMRFSADGMPVNRSQTGIHRPPSSSPRPHDGRRVGFKEETEEIDMYDRSPPVPPKDAPPAKSSKWQPLSTVEPSPIGDNDPFSLGDSEDEKDNKDAKDTAKDKPKDSTSDEGERLKKAAAEAMADNLVDSGKDSSSKAT